MVYANQSLAEHAMVVLLVVLLTVLVMKKKKPTRNNIPYVRNCGRVHVRDEDHLSEQHDPRHLLEGSAASLKTTPKASGSRAHRHATRSPYRYAWTRLVRLLHHGKRRWYHHLRPAVYRARLTRVLHVHLHLKGWISFLPFNKQPMKLGKWMWHNNVMKLGWWRHLMGNKASRSPKRVNNKVALFMRIPFRDLSRWSGKLHTADLPRWLRQFFIHLYVWVYKCKVHEAVIDDLTKYKNLNEFFRRELKPGLRPVHPTCCLTSPADGRVLHQGRVEDGVLEQVKGVTYSLKGFLGPPDWCSGEPNISNKHFHKHMLRNPDSTLFYSIIYLGPMDYHRFHSPADWTINYQRHFPGELFSVNPSVARWLQGLFNYNERAVFYGEWQHGFFSMAAVGATNVGSIRVYFDEDLETNKPEGVNGSYYDKSYADGPVSLTKGENFGEFNIGSTIVLVFEAPATFQFSAKLGQKVLYGQHFGD